MSEAATTDLAVPAAPAAETAPAAPAPAPAAAAADETLITPEPVEGEAAAADSQGAADGASADGALSEGEQPEGKKDGEAEPPAAEAPQGAPEAYADFTMPEGFQLPADIGGDLTTLAKELNLPQAEAQKLIDLGVRHAQALQGAMAETLSDAKAQWADAVRADAEIGGEQFPVHMATAKKALTAFGTPALTQVLNQTGLSLHPEVLRLLVRVGEAISEDADLITGDGAGGRARGRSEEERATRMYPKMKPTG